MPGSWRPVEGAPVRSPVPSVKNLIIRFYHVAKNFTTLTPFSEWSLTPMAGK
jgi:hypothetical protein